MDKSTHKKLRLLAAKHGLSMEEEVRPIILQAVEVPEPMSALFEKHFGHNHGVVFKRAKRKAHPPMEFGE